MKSFSSAEFSLIFFLKNEIKLILETYLKCRSQLKFNHHRPSAFNIGLFLAFDINRNSFNPITLLICCVNLKSCALVIFHIYQVAFSHLKFTSAGYLTVIWWPQARTHSYEEVVGSAWQVINSHLSFCLLTLSCEWALSCHKLSLQNTTNFLIVIKMPHFFCFQILFCVTTGCMRAL